MRIIKTDVTSSWVVAMVTQRFLQKDVSFLKLNAVSYVSMVSLGMAAVGLPGCLASAEQVVVVLFVVNRWLESSWLHCHQL